MVGLVTGVVVALAAGLPGAAVQPSAAAMIAAEATRRTSVGTLTPGLAHAGNESGNLVAAGSPRRRPPGRR